MKQVQLFSLLCLLSAVFFVGCANVERKPMDPTKTIDDNEGPGLFSGDDGAFIIYED